MSLADALQITRLARPKINPNTGFMAQLALFSQQLTLGYNLWKHTVFSLPSAVPEAAASGHLLEYKESLSGA